MAEVINMPRLSDTMEEGVIAAWHVKVGDEVSSGDLLAEIESDKATMDFEAPVDGVVLHLGVEESKGIPVGSLLAIIGEKGEDVDDLIKEAESKKAAAPSGGNGKEEKEEQPKKPEEKEEKPEPEKQKVAAKTESKAQPEVSSAPPPPSSNGDRIKASPLARAMAKERGIDISRVQGSGDHGRIIRRDIENFKETSAPAGDGTPAFTAPQVMGEESYEEKAVSQMRKTIARRLSDSKFTAPHFYLTMEINMDRAVAARKALNETAPVKISFNDMVVKACAAALRLHPKVNAAWMGDTIRFNQHIHIGVAVAVEEGLLVPVIRFADQKGLAAISAETKELAGKARNKKLQPEEWEGNTFTISNLGMYGIEEFTAIINPPDACILAVGGIIEKPIVKDGEIVPGHMMKVTMSCDHRVVDGATGSEFLVTLKQMLEDPVRILL